MTGTALPRDALVALNCTVPVGVAPAEPVTVAVRVTLAPEVTDVGEAVTEGDEKLLPVVPPLQMFVSALHSGVTFVQSPARLARFTLPQPVVRSKPVPALNPVVPPLGQFGVPAVHGMALLPTVTSLNAAA